MLSGADLLYLSEQFVPLADLCDDIEDVRRRIASGDLPALPYPGQEFVPADYFELPLGDSFAERYRGDDLADDLDGLMSGMYFVCLREATPENIVRKDRLVTSVRALLAEPHPDNSTWCAALRSKPPCPSTPNPHGAASRNCSARRPPCSRCFARSADCRAPA